MRGYTPSLLSARRGSLVLLVQSDRDPTSDEWSRFHDDTAAAMAAHAGLCRVCVITQGGKPDASQRAMSMDRGWRGNRSPVAVLSDDALVRGVITAFAWLGLNVRAFKTAAMDDSFAYLAMTEDERKWVRAEWPKMLDRLAISTAKAR